jgi:hypothetical protein
MKILQFDKDDKLVRDFTTKLKQETDKKEVHSWIDGPSWKRLDHVECIVHESEIVGISGSKIYDNYLRISSPQYVLKEYRNVYRNSLFCPNGFFLKHLNWAKNNNYEIFFSIHAYNKRMKYHAENLYKRRITLDKDNLIKELNYIKFHGIHKFHNVDQYIYSYGVFDLQKLLDVISRTNNAC